MKKLHFYFVFLYIFILLRTMIACYRIKGFNYLYAFLLFLSGVVLYKLYSLPFSKRLAKPFMILMSASALALLYKFEWLVFLWDKYIVQNFDAINLGIYNGTETYFHQFFPFLAVLVPV
ncbi:MAG: hypothetical protein ACM3ZR_06195, partial [Pseudomonadota bacterium]